MTFTLASSDPSEEQMFILTHMFSMDSFQWQHFQCNILLSGVVVDKTNYKFKIKGV